MINVHTQQFEMEAGSKKECFAKYHLESWIDERKLLILLKKLE